MEKWRNLKLILTIMAMTLILMLTLGLMLSFGVFLVDFKLYFETGSGVVGAVSSLCVAVFCFSGPLTSIFGQRFGCRIAICIGCCLASLGFFLSSLVREPWHLLLSHSIVTGIGCSLIFVNIIPLLGICSEKQHTVANGIVYSGNSVGIVMFPVVCGQLRRYYGFRGALLVVSALSLNGLVLALLLKFADEKLKQKTEDKHPKKENDCSLVREHEKVEDAIDDEDSSALNHQFNQAAPNSKFTIFGSLKSQITLFCKFPRFGALLFANVFLSIGYVGFLVHMVANATYIGLSDSQSTLIASIYGVGNIIGRLTHAVPIKLNWISAYTLFWLSCLIDSILMLFYPFCSSTILLFFLTAIIAYNVGIHIPLFPVMVRIFVGDEYFHHGFGILLLPGGLGCLIGGFAAGWIYDLTNSYRDAFFFMAASYLIVPLIFLVVEVFLWRTSKKAKMYNIVHQTPVTMQQENTLEVKGHSIECRKGEEHTPV